jgi:tetratricopeptide (TPR) repeat protein
MSYKYLFQLLTPLALSLLVASNSVALADPTFGASRKEQIHETLYKIYKQQRQMDLMRSEVTAILALNPNNVVMQQDWAHQLTVASKFKEAIPHWVKVTKAQPMSSDSWAALGDCYMQLGNYNGALGVYTKAIQTQRAGQDFRPRYQVAQQYIEHAKQEKIFNEQKNKQKEDSDD